jgi:putative membrane protein
MTTTITLAFLHHTAAVAVMALLTVELVLLRFDLTPPTARTILRMDAAYGIAALVLLVVGLSRVFFTEKGAAYYFHSGTFILKFSLFVIVGLLSIYPTMQFMRWRPALREQRVPQLDPATRSRLRMLVHIELTLLLVILLLAPMMARGIWSFGKIGL